jgi:hypothetical protein
MHLMGARPEERHEATSTVSLHVTEEDRTNLSLIAGTPALVARAASRVSGLQLHASPAISGNSDCRGLYSTPPPCRPEPERRYIGRRLERGVESEALLDALPATRRASRLLAIKKRRRAKTGSSRQRLTRRQIPGALERGSRRVRGAGFNWMVIHNKTQ